MSAVSRESVEYDTQEELNTTLEDLVEDAREEAAEGRAARVVMVCPV